MIMPWQDLRFGARMLRKSPGSTLTVVVTLGLGIGLNSAIFSMVSGILLREPPVQHPDRVVVVTFANPAKGSDQNPASALEFSTLREEGHVFKAVAAASYDDVAMTLGSTFTPGEDPSTQQSNGAFAALALGLAALGIYGLVSYVVAQRTHEIGLRMALGAQKGSVFRLVVGNGARLATIGTALGFLLALPISRILGSAHPDSWARSLLVLAMAPALVILATLLACYLPARRATRVDPMTALRCE